mgnify:FL=1|jgi:genome maintenance exonuclease 1|tara:strand:- start:884 stop:1564 length:681 start_codon:yes stop_codon:yes gene_type:complete
MKWNKLYHYPPCTRSTTDGLRTYDIGKEKLPSVTTILGATQSDEKKAALDKWKARVGIVEADRIRDTSAARGTNMHLHLEKHVLGEGHLDLTPGGKVAKVMADVIIEKGLKDMSEVWGTEVTLYYPGKYAGQTDLVGVYDYEDSIVDYKQSNRPKRIEYIDDYFMQLGAYAMAHNQVYKTDITQGVVLICTPDHYFQKFSVNGKKFIQYQNQFLERVDKYYEQRNN